MATETLKVARDEFYDILTIHRPEALNAINDEVMEALYQYFSKSGPSDTTLRGVIITGAGDRSFVAGADIAGLMTLTEESAEHLTRKGHEVFDLIEAFHVPVIAAVNGFALGGGCELAMACHMRIASEKARFGLPELGLGLIPGYGGTQRLVQYVGRTKAVEMILTSNMMDAREAHDSGLVNKVVSAGEEVAESKEVLRQISSKGPQAVTEALRCINAFHREDTDGFELERKIFSRLVQSKEGREGMQAFLQKRKPNF
jgi:enoyl-CoA hydratase